MLLVNIVKEYNLVNKCAYINESIKQTYILKYRYSLIIKILDYSSF